MNRYRFIDEKKEHLHTLDSRPLIGNTTAINNVLAKNLTWWAAELSAVECLEVGEHIPSIREEYELACAAPNKKVAIDALQVKYPLFRKARYAHHECKNKSADKGTDMHAELEEYSKFCITINEGKPMPPADTFSEPVKIFAAWAMENVSQFLYAEVNAYHEELWTGGITDLVYLDKQDHLVVLDHKSAKTAYFSHFVQCALCDLELSHSGPLDKDGNSLGKLPKAEADYYAVFPFGAFKSEPVFFYDTVQAKEAAKHIVGLHKILVAQEEK